VDDDQRVIATKMIETRLHLYNTFFDVRWAQDLSLRMPNQLSQAFDHLCLAWEEAANTHRLPWLMVQQMKGFADGLTRNHGSEDLPLQSDTPKSSSASDNAEREAVHYLVRINQTVHATIEDLTRDTLD